MHLRVRPFTLLFLLSVSVAQEFTIEGTVNDAATGKPIAGVNIFVERSQVGSVSENDGNFALTIPDSLRNQQVIFTHIGYQRLSIPAVMLQMRGDVQLIPTTIPLQQVGVEGTERNVEIERDIPQPISIIESETFELRGYTDAGDLLRTDHTIQLDENLTGKKTINMRGGNADEVVVLYNGVRLNSDFDNIFDISLVSLQNVDHIQLIRGSNSVLYGSEAFSGIVNIVPKLMPDQTLSFSQRLGTYQSGSYNAHLGRTFDRFTASYDMNRGAFFRQFEGSNQDESLENSSDQHALTFTYRSRSGSSRDARNVLSSTILFSGLSYRNHRHEDVVDNDNLVTTVRYSGALGPLPRLSLTVSEHVSNERQRLSASTANLERSLKSGATRLAFRSTGEGKYLTTTSVIQLERANLDYRDHLAVPGVDQLGLESAQFSRTKLGVAFVTKLTTGEGERSVRYSDVSVSIRRDLIIDRQEGAILRQGTTKSQLSDLGLFDSREWENTIVKLSTSLSGGSEQFAYRTYFNSGTGFKYPTLFQQISGSLLDGTPTAAAVVNPEMNRSVEFGIETSRLITSSPSADAFDFTANLFRNDYENKMRVSYPIGVPVAFYDNVMFAKLSGFELKGTLHLFDRTASADLGVSRYNIPEKAAFPFKSELKLTGNLNVEHDGWSFQVHGFRESEQIGWVRQDLGHLFEVVLPPHANVDVHLSKTVKVRGVEGFANFSGYNLRNRSTVLQGLILRDRRLYLSFGFKL